MGRTNKLLKYLQFKRFAPPRGGGCTYRKLILVHWTTPQCLPSPAIIIIGLGLGCDHVVPDLRQGDVVLLVLLEELHVDLIDVLLDHGGVSRSSC